MRNTIYIYSYIDIITKIKTLETNTFEMIFQSPFTNDCNHKSYLFETFLLTINTQNLLNNNNNLTTQTFTIQISIF